MLLWADGFDHWGTDANLQTAYSISNGVVLSTAHIRTGSKCLSAPNNRSLAKKSLAPTNQLIIGMAVYQDQQQPVANNPFMFHLADASNNVICQLRFDANQQLIFNNGNAGAVLGSSLTGAVPLLAYNYVEMKIDNSAGVGNATIRVNNNVVLSLTGAPITNTNPITTFAFGGDYYNVNAVAIPSWVADFYMADFTAPYNDFFGDIRCRTIYPAANGAAQDWTPHGAANAWDCINDVPPQPGVDYISSSVVGDLSSFGMTQIPTNTAAIFGLMLFTNLNKTDAGTCSITPGIDSGGSIATVPAISPGTGSAFYNGAIQVDPQGGGPWNYNRVNTLLARVQRTA